jgi:hypothetical protein
MHPRAQLEPERPHGVADGEPAAHAARRSVEQRLASVIFGGGLRLLESRAPPEPLLTRPETRGRVFTADEKN